MFRVHFYSFGVNGGSFQPLLTFVQGVALFFHLFRGGHVESYEVTPRTLLVS